MAYQLILASLRDMFRGDDCPEMEVVLGEAIVECGVPSCQSVGLLKDKGNAFFKMGFLPLAFLHYKLALKFILLMGIPTSYDEPSATSLALSIFLNLAACELKTTDYDQVCRYCSLILMVQPSNVKALYRRGLAFKNLNLFPKAIADFEYALKITPHNKDISRELQDVHDRLAINSNGKRESSQTDPAATERKGKKPLLSSASLDDCVPSLADSVPVSLPTLSPDQVPMDSESLTEVPMESACCPAPSEAVKETVVDDTVSSASSKSSNFIFINRKKPHNKLNLSSEAYENLMSGKNLEFFHPRSMSIMRVRPLISKTIQTGTPLNLSGTAEVPISSPVTENFDTQSNVMKTESAALIQEDVIFQVEKKKRLSSVSSHISKVSVTKFKFAAVGNQLHSKWRCNRSPSYGNARQGQASIISKKRSLVSVEVSVSFTKVAHSTTQVARAKRKEFHSIEFDTHYHPPFKKYRCFSSVSTSSSFTSVTLSSSGVSNPPVFVF